MKNSLRILKIKYSNIEGKVSFKRSFYLIFHICFILSLLLSFSCATKQVNIPIYNGFKLEDVISEHKKINSIEALLSIEFDRGDNIMSGDAFVNIGQDRLDMRLYYLGFLAGEVREENSIIKSNPKLDPYRLTILVDGLKNSFMWWKSNDFIIEERKDFYVLKDTNKIIFINKQSLLPIKQTILILNGEELNIFYDEPVRYVPENEEKNNVLNGGLNSTFPFWYNSRLTITYKNYLLKIRIKSYSII